jgi:two-component system, LytTR family, sensor kinase
LRQTAVHHLLRDDARRVVRSAAVSIAIPSDRLQTASRADATVSSRPAVWRRLSVALWMFALSTALVLFFASQMYILGGRDMTWGVAIALSAPRWYAWGLLAPAIAWSDRLVGRGRSIAARLWWHVPLALAWTGVNLMLRLLLFRPLIGSPWPSSIADFVLERAYWDVLIYAVIAGVAASRDYAARVRDEERRSYDLQVQALELQQLLNEARLQSLRSQLQPHFLFNALNTISSLTESDPRTARRLMDQLGQLLRVSLRHAEAPLVTLAEELTFLDDYLAIESVRFEGRIRISVQADDATLEALVPGFLLQPLVENAIRHGVGPRLSGGRVDVTAVRAGARLKLAVTDDGLGLPANLEGRREAGVGLRNTAARLEQLYPKDHVFRIEPRAEGGVRVHIELPWRRAPSQRPR